MNRSFIRRGGAVAVIALCSVGFGATACSSDDDATPVTTKDAGPATDTGTTPQALSLYDRLGGKAGLEAFVKKVVDEKVLVDADLKTYFFNQTASPIPAGHPSAQQITVCFARFVGTALGSDQYPGAAVNDAANTNTPNHTCRDMVSAHNKGTTLLNIGGATFDKFVGAIAASLQPLVKPTATAVGEITQAEFDTLAGALNGQKTDVTTPGAPDSGPFVAPDLYARLGGKDGLEAFVTNIVTTKILTDVNLKTYFFNQVASPIPAGHPSAKQIEVCFARFVGAALTKDTYPGAAVNDPANANTPNHTCRDLVASHKGANTMLNIGSGTFDAFIGYIAAELQKLIVTTPPIRGGEISGAEFDALAAALNGQKTDVTTAGAPVGPAPFVAP